MFVYYGVRYGQTASKYIQSTYVHRVYLRILKRLWTRGLRKNRVGQITQISAAAVP